MQPRNPLLTLFTSFVNFRRSPLLDSRRAELAKRQNLLGAHENGLRLSSNAKRGAFDAAN